MVNAKKIDEIQPQDSLNVNSKIHVSINGISQSIMVSQIIAASSNNNTDQLLYIGEITVLGNIVTIPAGATWIIGGVNYSNPALIQITVPLSANGLARLDLLVANTLNQIVLEMGNETAGVVVPPSKPVNTVFVSQILVTDTNLGNPEQPIVGDIYVEKSESQNRLITVDGEIDVLSMIDEKSSIIFAGSVTKLKSISYPGIYTKIYNGKTITLYNRQLTDVTVTHGAEALGVNFIFPDEKDFILKPNQVITFFYDLSRYPEAHHMFIGDTGKEDISNKNQPDGYAGVDSSGKISSALLPSYVDDVIEVTNYAALPASGETGKIYITLDNNKQYRWSGSSYIQITNGLIATTDDVPEGSKLYFTTARVLATVLSGISFLTGGSILATDSILVAFGKIQKQINDFSSLFQPKDNRFYIGTSGNVQEAWSGSTVFFTSNCTITVPATLSTSFTDFGFRTMPGVTVTWSITSPLVWETTPTTTPEKKDGLFTRYKSDSNTIIIRW